LSSAIQGISRRIESKGSETSKGRRSQKMEDRKNIKQKKSKRSSKVFSTIEEVYSKV